MFKKHIEDGIIKIDPNEALFCRSQLRSILAPVLKKLLEENSFADSNPTQTYRFSLCKPGKKDIYSIEIIKQLKQEESEDNPSRTDNLKFEKIRADLLIDIGFTEKARQLTETLIKRLLNLDDKLILSFWVVELSFYFYNNQPLIVLHEMNAVAR